MTFLKEFFNMLFVQIPKAIFFFGFVSFLFVGFPVGLFFVISNSHHWVLCLWFVCVVAAISWMNTIHK